VADILYGPPSYVILSDWENKHCTYCPCRSRIRNPIDSFFYGYLSISLFIYLFEFSVCW